MNPRGLFKMAPGRRNWDEYAAHIQGHGPPRRPFIRNTSNGVEGDTPSFLYVLPNGLNDPENPGVGGWGGYFIRGNQPGQHTQRPNVNSRGPRRTRFRENMKPAFTGHLQRFCRPDGLGEGWYRQSKSSRESSTATAALPRRCSPRRRAVSVTLDASASRDPRRRPLKFSWWVLPEAGTLHQRDRDLRRRHQPRHPSQCRRRAGQEHSCHLRSHG